MAIGRNIAHASILCEASQDKDVSGLGMVDGLVIPHPDAKDPAFIEMCEHVDAIKDID